MEYYISVIKEQMLSIVRQTGWVSVAFAAAVVLALLVMFGKNVRWKR
jgi:acid phosphatase family membrane protein YuiD